MNAPIPLRPDFSEAARIEHRAWSRALAAQALSSPQRSAERILKSSWPHDPRAAAILKTAVSPTSTADFPPVDVVAAFRSLAPGSAAWKLFAHEAALKLDLKGVHQINVPHVAAVGKKDSRESRSCSPGPQAR
ncbi:hypothetical protein Q2941_39965 [Bradyrhizobium sp. UFLA05-153]